MQRLVFCPFIHPSLIWLPQKGYSTVTCCTTFGLKKLGSLCYPTAKTVLSYYHLFWRSTSMWQRGSRHCLSLVSALHSCPNDATQSNTLISHNWCQIIYNIFISYKRCTYKNVLLFSWHLTLLTPGTLCELWILACAIGLIVRGALQVTVVSITVMYRRESRT